MENMIMNPIIQYAFAGFCGVLMGIIVWLIKQLLAVIEKNNSIIAQLTHALAENTSAVRSVQEQTRAEHKEFEKATYSLRDAINKRRCLADKGD